MVNKSLKIAHFIKDEKFPDYAYDMFEAVAPGANFFYMPGREVSLRYIKRAPVEFVGKLAVKNPLFYRRLRKYDFIVLHGLGSFNCQLLLHSPGDLRFVWIGMGYDYYPLLCDRDELYLDKTKKIAFIFEKKEKSFSASLRAMARHILYRRASALDLLKRIDYFSPVLSEEYDLFRERFGHEIAPYIDWNYSAVASTVDGDVEPSAVAGKDILLGNSAALTNNHVEALELLAGIELGDRRIVCPLSYGNERYGEYIEKLGSSLFGERFVALRSFLPYDQYMGIISGCSNVIMNHLRQQAVGNVVAMLYQGGKVFLNRDNPLYGHCIRAGVKIFTVEELYAEPSLLTYPLHADDVEMNRRVVKSLWSRDVVFDKTRKLIEAFRKQ